MDKKRIAKRVANSIIAAEPTDRQKQVMGVIEHERARMKGSKMLLMGLKGDAIHAVVFKNGGTWITQKGRYDDRPTVLKLPFSVVMRQAI